MYSAVQLESFNDDFDKGGLVVQQLVRAMDAGQQLSIAEEDFVGRYLHVARDEDNKLLSLHQINSLHNFLFKRNYLIYLNNFSGEKVVRTPLGVISISEVEKDVAFLNKQYRYWLAEMRKGNHSDSLLQYVAAETRNHLKNNAAFSKKMQHGSRLKAAAEKSVVLHSKYLYYKVKQYFQELGKSEIFLENCGRKIIIDADSYFHILFRHYAGSIKTYQSGKSYHADQCINPDELPTILYDIIIEYFKNIPCFYFNGSRIYVEINNILYAIWFKEIEMHQKGQPKENILRVQTFYPVDQQNETDFVKGLSPTSSTNGRAFYA